MSGPTITRAVQLAAQLRGAGIAATHDATAIGALAPAVLVGPPRLAFDTASGSTAVWRLLAVAGSADPLTAWDQVDQLVHQVAELLPVETAEPTAFAASASDDPLPAYALTLTD